MRDECSLFPLVRRAQRSLMHEVNMMNVVHVEPVSPLVLTQRINF